jgi:D-alanyl-D-alanine carboxypeptidase
MAPGNWGIAVAADNGSLLWSIRPDQPLIPASAVKLFTTGFARTVLGAGARRSTRVVGSGYADPATGEWIGAWALQVNGDPSLERANGSGPKLVYLAQRANGSGPKLVYLAQQLAARGVRRLTGPFEVQSAAGPAEAWFPAEWSDRHRA